MSYWSYRSYRGVQDCQCGEPQITKNTETTEKTERHRDGRRVSARRTASVFWESQRTRRTQSKRRRGGPCVRVKRTSESARPARGPVGAWRASHAMLWGRGALRPGPAGDAGDSGDTGAPLWGDGGEFQRKRRGAKRRAAGAVSGEAAERPMEPEAVRETEGGGRGQRRSRRATDGARSGSRPP